jgi:hypothetical protein
VREVQRTLAFGLLVACIVAWFCPFLVACISPNSESNLPACCRRHGKHHCSASIRYQRSNKTFSSPSQQCPFFPQATPSQTSIAEYLHVCFVAYDPARTTVALKCANETVHRYSPVRSHPKRGPPRAYRQNSLT